MATGFPVVALLVPGMRKAGPPLHRGAGPIAKARALAERTVRVKSLTPPNPYRRSRGRSSAERTPRNVRTSWLDQPGLVNSVRSVRRVVGVRSGGK